MHYSLMVKNEAVLYRQWFVIWLDKEIIIINIWGKKVTISFCQRYIIYFFRHPCHVIIWPCYILCSSLIVKVYNQYSCKYDWLFIYIYNIYNVNCVQFLYGLYYREVSTFCFLLYPKVKFLCHGLVDTLSFKLVIQTTIHDN